MIKDFSDPDLLSRYWSQLSQHIGRAPAWEVPDQIRGNGIILRRFDFGNYLELVKLFQDDPSEYIDDRFRHVDATVEFLIGQLGDAAYCPTNGAVDYLVIDAPSVDMDYVQVTSSWLQGAPQLPEGARLTGLIHLYHLDQREGDYRKVPKVGIMVAEAFRGLDVSDRAMRLLHDFAHRTFHVPCLEAEVASANERSIRFFEKLGYVIQRKQGKNVLLRLVLDQ